MKTGGPATARGEFAWHWAGPAQQNCNICNWAKARRNTSLIAGKTGSGKSTLLHAIVTNLALTYSPDQIELYLIDFKKGVEFKTYATHSCRMPG